MILSTHQLFMENEADGGEPTWPTGGHGMLHVFERHGSDAAALHLCVCVFAKGIPETRLFTVVAAEHTA